MKKVSVIFFLTAIFILVLAPGLVLAVDCPLGKVDDPAPGVCGLYNDTNRDAICDLSESNQTLYATEQSQKPESNTSAVDGTVKQTDHRLGLITIILVSGYLAGLLAVYKKKILAVKHRKFWNWLLLILFIPTALTSLFLALVVEFSWHIDFGIDLSYWHFVFGWAFLIVSIFHTLWHTAYYFRRIKK
jgi:hypothetical protein